MVFQLLADGQERVIDEIGGEKSGEFCRDIFLKNVDKQEFLSD